MEATKGKMNDKTVKLLASAGLLLVTIVWGMNEINKEFILLWNGDDMEALKEFNEKLNIMAEMYRV